MKAEHSRISIFRRRESWLFATAFILLAALWFFLPRPVKPLDFDPDMMARLETQMWRTYYDKNYPELTYQLWEATRTQFGGSPFNALQIAYQAAQAARIFQASRNRDEAEAALPPLLRYYQLLQKQSGNDFDPAVAAAMELDWWQLRREHAPPEKIIAVLSELYGLVNNQSPAVMVDAVRYRVEAMAFRDARRNSGLVADEWNTLEEILRLSYHHLREAVHSGEQQS